MAVGSDNVYNMVKPDKENARARELVSKMTLEEKCDYIGAVTSFVMRSVDRLGIPQIRMADGPRAYATILSALFIRPEYSPLLHGTGIWQKNSVMVWAKTPRPGEWPYCSDRA